MSSPLDLRGPEFLILYAGLLVAAFVMAILLRRSMRYPIEDQFEAGGKLDAYELAQLAGGRVLAVQAALAQLMDQGDLEFDKATRRFRKVARPDRKRPEFEQAALDSVADSGPFHLGNLVKALATPCARIQEGLEAAGLVVSRSTDIMARTVSSVPFLLLLGLGLMKIQVGVARGKPIVFLVMLCMITGLIWIFWLATRVHRSRWGDAVLARLRRDHAPLKVLGSGTAPTGREGDLPLAVGLFGAAILARGPMRDFYTAMMPPGGSGTSCGGSSCGGGGGGGGCGGGGCGGCGG